MPCINLPLEITKKIHELIEIFYLNSNSWQMKCQELQMTNRKYTNSETEFELLVLTTIAILLLIKNESTVDTRIFKYYPNINRSRKFKELAAIFADIIHNTKDKSEMNSKLTNVFFRTRHADYQELDDLIRQDIQFYTHVQKSNPTMDDEQVRNKVLKLAETPTLSALLTEPMESMAQNSNKDINFKIPAVPSHKFRVNETKTLKNITSEISN